LVLKNRVFLPLMSFASSLDYFYDSILTVVYPQACGVCAGSVESRADGCACSNCWSATAIVSGAQAICWKCGLPAPVTALPIQPELIRCGHCDAESFAAARSCGLYEKALRASVLALKRQPHVPRRLAQLLESVARIAPLDRAERIIPVPLHPHRLKVRGFNQAEVIGSELARRLRCGLDSSTLVRVLHTDRHRAGMDAPARRETVAGAFEVRHPRVIAGESILLVDDVFTTGATVSACARALLSDGAKEVLVLTIARVPYW
jgi:ComF family protein